LNRNRQADVATCANARLVLEALGEGLQGVRYDNWLEQVRLIEQKKQAEQSQWEALDDAPVNHFRFAAEVNGLIDENTIVVGDGGDIVTACARVLNITQAGQWLDPGPLGCLGVGIPFAIAAQHLYPQKRVLVINGDGAFGLNGFEFDTAVRFKLPIVSIVGNDAGWGNIRVIQQQMLGEERAVATGLAATRYDKIVEAMGGYGEHVDRPAEMRPAIERALGSGKPACVNVSLDPKGLVKTAPNMAYIL
jgi:acetolactate synthase-1/2/3 large subunit